MSTEDFIELLRKPETIANYSLDELRDLSHRFSYSQPLQLLYAMRLKYSSQHLFDRQLGKTSILTNNRKVLFELFEETTPVPTPSEQVNLSEYSTEEAQAEAPEQPGASAEPEAEKTEAPAPAPQAPRSDASQPALEAEREENQKAPEAQEPAKAEPQEIPEQGPAPQAVEKEAVEDDAATAGDAAEEQPAAETSPKAEEATKPEAAEKPSPKSAMSERIREILEKNRRIREEALARKEGRPLPPKEEAVPAEKQADPTPREEASAEAEDHLSQQPESSKESPPEQPQAESQPEIHSAEAPKAKDEDETLEGQSLVDEPQRQEASQTTNDFVEEDLPYQRQEGYEDKGESLSREADQEPESTLEEEVQQDEHQRQPVENTTNDFAEEQASAPDEAEPEPEAEERPQVRAEGLSSLEERIAGIRSRLEKLGAEKEQEQPLEPEESESGLADDLDQEFRDIQSRSEHLHDASFERKAMEDVPEEQKPEDLFEVDDDAFDPISNEEAQQMSFSRWLKQFEKKEEQIEKQTEETRAADDSEQEEKASLKFEDKMQLLDSFVEKLPDLKKRKPLISNPPPKANYEEVQGEKEAEEDNGSSLVTETLAKVYIKQKHYKKAIQAYEILRLKYPEKSSLFADRISEIKKLENSK